MLRATGYFVVLFWLASMTWLVWHDVWPGLTAGDAPEVAFRPESGSTDFQVGIFDANGRRMGTIWSSHHQYGQTPRRDDTIYLESLPGLGRLLIEIESQFTARGLLDEFDLQMFGLELDIHIHGERFTSVYGFHVQAGRWRETFKIDADGAGLIGDAFRPFAALPGLTVGQSWRMQVVNPLAVVTGLGRKFNPIVVRVTGREPIALADRPSVDCLVVEAPGVKAWVDSEGRVLVQEVELPVGGTITLRDEPYDEEAIQEAKTSRVVRSAWTPDIRPGAPPRQLNPDLDPQP
ncbi:MAG: hypothetical protein GY778_04450 [bacterium]|nr:hypothetical protein [bacterium]